MPKSRRKRPVILTQVKKKGRVLKEQLSEAVREAIQTHEHVYVFVPENVRNNSLKTLRIEWKPTSRFFMGKNKVMKVALGRDASEAFRPGLDVLAEQLTGVCGLLCTNKKPEEVEEFFRTFADRHTPRAGFIATREFVVPAGPVLNMNWPTSMEPHLRKLGLPTKLVNGVIRMESETVVCSPGDELTPEQCRILKLYSVDMAPFRLRLVCRWSASTQECVMLDSEFEDDDSSAAAGAFGGMDDDDEDDDEDDEDDEDVDDVEDDE